MARKVMARTAVARAVVARTLTARTVMARTAVARTAVARTVTARTVTARTVMARTAVARTVMARTAVAPELAPVAAVGQRAEKKTLEHANGECRSCAADLKAAGRRAPSRPFFPMLPSDPAVGPSVFAVGVLWDVCRAQAAGVGPVTASQNKK